MSKAIVIEDLQRDLNNARNRLEIQARQLVETDKVERIIIAAGLLDKEKFDQARELINPNN